MLRAICGALRTNAAAKAASTSSPSWAPMVVIVLLIEPWGGAEWSAGVTTNRFSQSLSPEMTGKR